MVQKRHSRKGIFAILKAVIAALNIAVGAFTVFSAYGGVMDPEYSSSGAIAAMLFPLAIAATVLFLIASLLWSGRMVVINLLVVAACWSPLMSICPLNLFRENPEKLAAEGDTVIKVVTFNTFGMDEFAADTPSSPNRTLQFMIDTDADVLLCQELHPELRSSVKGITAEQIRDFEKRYPYRHIDNRGMGIFSKHPFEKVPLHYADSYKFDVCRYDVTMYGRVIHVFNLHLQSIGLTREDKRLYRHITQGDSDTDDIDDIRHGLLDKLSVAFCERAKQAAVVRDAVDSAGDSNVIVAGDFNDIPLCHAARLIAGDDLRDVYRTAGLGPQISYHADRFYFRIDQMYVRGVLEPVRATCGGTFASDHYPLSAWFTFSDK